MIQYTTILGYGYNYSPSFTHLIIILTMTLGSVCPKSQEAVSATVRMDILPHMADLRSLPHRVQDKSVVEKHTKFNYLYKCILLLDIRVCMQYACICVHMHVYIYIYMYIYIYVYCIYHDISKTSMYWDLMSSFPQASADFGKYIHCYLGILN